MVDIVALRCGYLCRGTVRRKGCTRRASAIRSSACDGSLWMEEVQQALAFLTNLGPILAPQRLDRSDEQCGGSIVAPGLPDCPKEAVHQHEPLQERAALVARIHDPASILVRQEDVVVQRQEADRCRSLGIREWSVAARRTARGPPRHGTCAAAGAAARALGGRRSATTRSGHRPGWPGRTLPGSAAPGRQPRHRSPWDGQPTRRSAPGRAVHEAPQAPGRDLDERHVKADHVAQRAWLAIGPALGQAFAQGCDRHR